jgi:hypothetical protein
MSKLRWTQEAGIGTGKAILSVILGGLLVHFIVMIVDYLLVSHPIYLDLKHNFWGSAFSVSMLPMMGTYIMFLVVIYSVWIRWKKAILIGQIETSRKREVEIVFSSMQRLTGILAEKISIHNADIIKWIKSRKALGKPVSNKVKVPTFMISEALGALTEIAFISPYTDKRPQDVKEIEKLLNEKLEEKQDKNVVLGEKPL